MSKEIVRDYKMEDELMLTRAQTMKDFLNDDLALFTAKFPWVDATYVTSFQTDIATALAFPQDNTVMSNLKVLTDDVNASVAEGIQALNALDIYAQLAYPDNRTKQRVFGQDTWEKARSDQEKMASALHHAHELANVDPYKAALMGKGYTQLDIDYLETVVFDIRTKNALQEKAKANRPVSTQDRIVVYNIVWSRMKTVSTCSRLVYRNDPAKLVQYQLYPSGSNVNTTVTVHVTKNTTPVEGAIVELTNTQLAQQTTLDDGNASFNSMNMPDAVDISVSHGVHGNVSVPDYPITAGDVNVIEVPM